MLLVLVLFTSASLMFWILALMVLADTHEKEPRLNAFSYSGPPEPSPLVSVIIPARDEEEHIASCIDAVLEQDYPRFEVIVVDDRSEDRTAGIVEACQMRDPRVRLIRGRPVPEGWAGKCHAIDQGVKAAQGEYLLMLDTDTFLTPRCLSMAVRDAVENDVDLYTLLFEAQCTSFWEKVIQPFMFQLLLMALPLGKVNDPARKEAAAPGPFLLFRRSAYEAIGGHAGMKDEVVEDLRLAQRIKQSGRRLLAVNAVSLVYSRRRIGFRAIWRGWSRVLYTGLDRNPLAAGLGFLGMALFLLLPWLIPPLCIYGLIRSDPSLPWTGLLGLGLSHCMVFLAIRRLMWVFYRLDVSLAWLQPLATGVCMAILANSVVLDSLSRPVIWKGRRYVTGGRPKANGKSA